MIVVDIKMQPEKIIALLKDVDNKIKNFNIPLKQSGILMMRSLDQNFREQGRPDKWEPLKSSTIKARKKGSATILQDDGTLKNSMTTEIRGADEVAIGTSQPYAPTHNFGSSQTRHKAWGRPSKPFTLMIPQRKFMLFQDEDRKRIDTVFLDHIEKATK